MRISQRSIEEVRETANIVEVASEFTALRRQGARYGGLCPYPDHSERTPSFSVSPDRGFYYCFGCQRGGDAIKLVSELKTLSFVEAVSHLAERSGIELEFEGESSAGAQAAKERNQRRRSIHRALAAAAVYYHKYLLNSGTSEAGRARNYLEGRGIERRTIEEFRLGFAPPRGGSGFVATAGKLGLNRNILEAAGLLSSRGGERFSDRITFPISDRRGRIVGFGARALGDDHPKYLNSPETEIFNKRDLLYGFPQVMEFIRKERSVVVVEGYTDVLMLYQAGIGSAVATLGTATTPAHLRVLSGYADKIHLLFDPDAAGEKAIERAAATAAELKLDLRVLRLTEDPADWLLEHTPEEFKGLLSGAIPAFEYVFRRKAGRARRTDAAGRSRIASEITDLIKSIEDPVFYQDAVRIAADALGVKPETLEIRRGRRGGGPSGPASAGIPADPHSEAGRHVLALMLVCPELTTQPLREGVKAGRLTEPLTLSPEDFCEEDQSRFFCVLSEHAGDADAALSDERVRPLMDQVARLQSEGEKLYPSEASVREAWLRLGILSRQRAKRETPDYDEKDRLQSEIQALKEALRAES